MPRRREFLFERGRLPGSLNIFFALHLLLNNPSSPSPMHRAFSGTTTRGDVFGPVFADDDVTFFSYASNQHLPC
jgi:hypothetical protein